MEDEPYFYHPLENIEDIDDFYVATDRSRLTKQLSEGRPYTYWTIELYDQKNGIRGGGGLGVLAADMRRIAERMDIPFTLVTPFYPSESHQVMRNGELINEHRPVDYRDFGFRFIDKVNIKCDGNICNLDVIEKCIKRTRIVAITEPNFGELYMGLSNSDHRLYQEVALGFGGYEALKLVGLKPAIMQLNEVATFFAALARLDELNTNGMDFYEAVVYTRKHTLYTNHTLVQAAEAEFSNEQFGRFVYPNLKSPAVRKWVDDKFVDGKLKLSSITIEIAEPKNGVSKLHTRVSNYHDVAGNRVKFKAITNGIDLPTWILPEIMNYYVDKQILDRVGGVLEGYTERLESLDAQKIRACKKHGREVLNETLKDYPDQNGNILEFNDEDFIFDFKRRLVDYKRPGLAFSDPDRLRSILETKNAHYIIAGRVHTGDEKMMNLLNNILKTIDADDFLKTHVHYIPDYDERLAYALSVGSNAAINVPIVSLEACGTSWMKDVGNFNILISTHDGGVADASAGSYLNVYGLNSDEEARALYQRMEEAIAIFDNDFDLEYIIKTQLKAFLPIISGPRMFKDYLDYLFKP